MFLSVKCQIYNLKYTITLTLKNCSNNKKKVLANLFCFSNFIAVCFVVLENCKSNAGDCNFLLPVLLFRNLFVLPFS